MLATHRGVWALALACGLAAAACEAAPPGQAAAPVSGGPVWSKGAAAFGCALRTERVAFADQGPAAAFRIEIAATPEEQERGLMNRSSLAPDAGMLFLFNPPRVTRFWMKNTLIPLDMIFMDAGGRVTYIERMAQPLTLEPRGPDGATAAVLEIAGGRAAAVGVKEGDSLACLANPPS